MMGPEIYEFFEVIPDEYQPLYMRLHEMVLAMYPDAEQSISYGIPKYSTPWGMMWLGKWKGGISVYTGHPSKLAEFMAKHPELRGSKGTINFKPTNKIPIRDLKALIKYAMEAKKPGRT